MPARRTSSKSFTIAGDARREERQSNNKKEARHRLKKRSRKACAPRDPNFDLRTFKVMGQRTNRKSYVIRGAVFLCLREQHHGLHTNLAVYAADLA